MRQRMAQNGTQHPLRSDSTQKQLLYVGYFNDWWYNIVLQKRKIRNEDACFGNFFLASWNILVLITFPVKNLIDPCNSKCKIFFTNSLPWQNNYKTHVWDNAMLVRGWGWWRLGTLLCRFVLIQYNGLKNLLVFYCFGIEKLGWIIRSRKVNDHFDFSVPQLKKNEIF